MCGGRGSRLDVPVEKPLLEVGGRPMVERVLTALEGSAVERVHAVTSPNAPATRAHLDDRPVNRIETPGGGYVDDLGRALARVDGPALTVAADLPLLEADAVDAVLDARDGGSLTACVPAALKRRLGVSADRTVERAGRELAPCGINVVSDRGTDSTHVSHDVRVAVNVNRRADARVAEVLA
jgi:adenosylcobinamide-phosphate guanylyltransferase